MRRLARRFWEWDGMGCGALVFTITRIWRGALASAVMIGTSVMGGVIIAALAGFFGRSLLHALKLDPKIAAGPAVRAATDVLTLLLYLCLARRAL